MEYFDGKFEPLSFTTLAETNRKEIVIEQCHGKNPRILDSPDGMHLECPVCGRKSRVFTIKPLGDGGFISKDFFQVCEEWNREVKNQPSSQNSGAV